MKFHIYQDKRGEWRWRLKARNGRIVADSGEGYKTQRNAERAVDWMLDRMWRQYPVIVEPRNVA